MAGAWATDEDAEEPGASAVDGRGQHRAKADNGKEDHDWNGGADAVRQQSWMDVAGFDAKDDHLGQGKSDAEAAEHRQSDALSLRAQDGLADEVEDRSLGGIAQNVP